MITLNIPQRRDPIARFVLIALFVLALYANVAQFTIQPTNAQGEIIILTPTPALPTLPTPALELPVIGLNAPTPEAAQLPDVSAPVEWPNQPVNLVEATITPTTEPAYVYIPAPESSDPATQPGTPEFNAALADIHNNLPTIQCPCGVVEESAEPHVMTEAEKAYSRARTR
jgi:hypothetical protein